MRLFFFLILLLCMLFNKLFADSLHVLFVYGSKPNVKGESHWFGGKHGGHVSVGYKDKFISFVPSGKFHVFPKDSFHSEFTTEGDDGFVFDTTHSRYLLLTLFVTPETKKKLDSIGELRLQKPSYDYAFFGFRCASSAYELLASAGILPTTSHGHMVRKFFYPKKLRKYLLKMANAKGWKLYYRPGRKTRKWEGDGRFLS